MQVSISARHGHLGEASQEKLKARAEKLARIFERIMAIEVTVDLKNEQVPEVGIHVSAEHKHDFVAHATSETLQGALDGAVQKIEQQLRKYKERVQERHRNSNARHMDVGANLAEEGVADELVEE
ncbi:Ribosome hibernation promoting factor [Bythopirellula polymerisocia]|uniref:Ribosome hibernation promoting factor n=1 Tax=Bythopirellula polymerisocia TaxID=2528003 RepID=A0A5C6CZZ5_9BACT|nr:Ribosome hibernation promoting factor [Bythopirellula polymerisocia]